MASHDRRLVGSLHGFNAARPVPLLQCCLNGNRAPSDHGSIPASARELAEEASAAVAAGARDLHLHPKSAEGVDTIEPRIVAEVLAAVREACPGVPVGVTTGDWIAPLDERIAAVRSWTETPDHASVNWHEHGADDLCRVLLERGVNVEAGIWSTTDGLERFRASALRDQVLRVLVEITDERPQAALDAATGMLARLEGVGRPLLLHGQGAAAWEVLREASRRRLSTRIGLEDVLVLPDGSPASDNAALVLAAADLGPASWGGPVSR